MQFMPTAKLLTQMASHAIKHQALEIVRLLTLTASLVTKPAAKLSLQKMMI
jgi:hypothetical protein